MKHDTLKQTHQQTYLRASLVESKTDHKYTRVIY